jgi:hypothetical protein
MIGPQLQLLGGSHRALLPVVLHRTVVETIPKRAKQETGEFPVMKAWVEGFEACNLLAYRLGDAVGLVMRAHVGLRPSQSQHPLGLELLQQGAHGLGVGVRGLRPLGRGALVEEDKGANQFIAPLDRIDKVWLQLATIARGIPHGFLPGHAPCVVETEGCCCTSHSMRRALPTCPQEVRGSRMVWIVYERTPRVAPFV